MRVPLRVPAPLTRRGLLATLAAGAVAVGGLLALAGARGMPGGASAEPAGTWPTHAPVAAPIASANGSSAGSPSGSPVGSPARGGGGPPAETPVPEPFPGLVGAIGDSLTAAVNADGEFGIQPEHSWVVGTDSSDPVHSHLERLRALGGDPVVVEPYRPGAPIGTAPAQADAIVEAADALPADATSYVTFELGANDVCAPSYADTTDPDAFRASAAEAFERLRGGLASRSVLLVLSVPDLTRVRIIAADVPAARSLHARYRVCESVLGQDADDAAIRDRIGVYNGILRELCEEFAGSPVTCVDDQDEPSRSLFAASIGLEDLSPLDFFHPSLRGQARIAEETWALTPWGRPATER